MPLSFRQIPIVLAGVEQKVDDKTRRPDALKWAVNVEHDKDGALNKRRGYQWVDPANAVNFNYPTDELMMRLAARKDELLVVTHDYVAAVGSKDAQLRGVESLVYRGPNNRAHVKLRTISISTASATLPEDPGA